jgi:hypothetical protein
MGNSGIVFAGLPIQCMVAQGLASGPSTHIVDDSYPAHLRQLDAVWEGNQTTQPPPLRGFALLLDGSSPAQRTSRMN